MDGQAAAGLVSFVCNLLIERYGCTFAELLEAAALDREDLRDPDALIPVEAVEDVIRFALMRTGDPALGLRMAEALDLRTQGFWGYALLSSMTFRQRIELHIRFQRLRGPTELSFRVEGERAIMEIAPRGVPSDVLPVAMDCSLAMTFIQQRRALRATPEAQVWVTYPEQPYHRELRAMASGPFVFGAPCVRVEFPARVLDLRLDGDPHLGKLATSRLDAQIERERERAAPTGVLERVRQRVTARLESDASLARIARDLRISARTLQRQLGAIGASFKELLDDVRRQHAIAYLSETERPIEEIAIRLGYDDPANFRRAFRRWTGVSPSLFRARLRTLAEASGPDLEEPEQAAEAAGFERSL